MHDPMAALPPRPQPEHPWAHLAEQARALAELADQFAGLAPADIEPAAVADLDARALDIQAAVAACRRATWQALYDGGVSAAEIGARWGVSRQRVSGKITTR